MSYSKEQQEKIIDKFIDTSGCIEYIITEDGGIDYDDLHAKLTILSLDADGMIKELKKNDKPMMTFDIEQRGLSG